MPHPDKLVTITTDTDIGAAPRDPFDTPTILGVVDSGSEPSAGFATATRHASAASVASSYGEGSEIAAHAEQAFAEGTNSLYAIAAEGTSATEILGESDTSTTSSGTVSNTPMSAAETVAISVDGTPMTVKAVTSSPPTDPDGSLDSDEAIYNPDTGEVETGTSSSGSGEGIEVTYTHADWTAALDEAAGVGTDILAFASGRIGRNGIGDMDEILTWADSNNVAVPVVYPNGQQYATVQEALDEAHDVGAFLTSKFGLPVASESSDTVAGRIVGRLAVNRPWYDIFLKTIGLSVPVPTRYRKYVGAPELPGTFEGGRSAGGGGSDSGAGAANVLMDDGGTVLTNSLSLAGLESDYRYLDVARTEAFIRDRIQTAVSDQFRDNSIRFNADGRTALRAAIEAELTPHTGGGNNPIRSFTPYVPPASEVSEQSRSNRIWSGITVEVTLAGYAHRADVTLTITV